MSIPITSTYRIGSIDGLSYTSSGKPKLGMRLVASKRVKDRDTGAWSDGPATWLTAIAWGDLAEAIDAASITKGTELLVAGDLAERRYTGRDGAERSVLELTIRQLGPTITGRQSVTVRRVTRDTAAEPQPDGQLPSVVQQQTSPIGDPELDPWASPAW